MNDTADLYGPPAPLRLWTHSFVHPGYRQTVTLDTGATNREDAFTRARRFMEREARRLARVGIKLRVITHANFLKLEMGA